MRSIDELKDTLDLAGEGAGAPLNPNERLASVQRRVRVVRRRRAGVTGAVMAVVVAMAGVAVSGGLPGVPTPGPGPAERSLAGHTVPETMTSLGYTYSFDEAMSGTNQVELDLNESDQPRLVSWAFSGVAEALIGLPDTATSQLVDHPVLSRGFDDYVFVPAGSRLNVRLSEDDPATGGLALAVYRLSEPAPGGVTKAGITFRDSVGQSVLLGAKIGDPGEDRIEFDVTVPRNLGALRLAPLCVGEAARYTVRVAGERVLSGGSCGHADFDAGVGGATVNVPEPWHAGETVRVYMTVRSTAADASAPFAGRLALGVYDEPEKDALLPQMLDEDGRTWTLIKTVEGHLGDGGAAVPTTNRRLLVHYAFAAAGGFAVQSELDGRPLDGVIGVGDMGMGGSQIWPGEGEVLRLVRQEDWEGAQTRDADLTYRVGFYEPID